MKALIVLSIFFTAVNTFAEVRCGWILNPTPANISLIDADTEWIIGEQGGYQAVGDIEYPNDDQYVNTNGNYGYFCGCIEGEFDKVELKVIKIKSSQAQLLKTCLQDENLPSIK
jgi:hypothetical protein